MQYVFNERRVNISSIEFKNTSPILNIDRIRFFREEGVVGNFIKKQFCYSFDNVTWSPWQSFTTDNLTSINFNDYNTFFLHIVYYREKAISGNIESIYITYEAKTITPYTPSDTSIIDADLLQGENGAYYLNLYNQFGGLPQNSIAFNNADSIGVFDYLTWDPSITNVWFRGIGGSGAATVSLQGDQIIIGVDPSLFGEVNAGQNVGSGDVSIYVGKSLNDLLFRTFKAGNGITLSYKDTNTIQIDVSVSSSSFTGNVSTSYVFYSTALNSSLAMPASVGGIPAGTLAGTLYGESLTTILDNLFFPTVYPTYVAPTLTFTVGPSTTLYEISSNISPAFTSTFNRGQILIGAIFQNYRSGLPNNYDFSGTGLVDVSSSSLTNNQTVSNYSVKSGYQNWSVNVGYNIGPQPLDSKGNNYGTPLSPGTLSSSIITLEGVYPLYATTVTIGTLTKQSLVSMITGNNIQLNLVAESGGNKGTFEIPNAWISSRPLVGVQTYNSLTSQWSYQGGTAGISLTYWTVTSDVQIIQGNSVSYNKYTYNGVDRSTVLIQLIF